SSEERWAHSHAASVTEVERARCLNQGHQEPPHARSLERAAGVCHHLEFGNTTPAQALQAAQLLLRHPPIPVQDGTPAAPWLQDIMALVDIAQRQAAPRGSLGPSRRMTSAWGARVNTMHSHQPPPRMSGEEPGALGLANRWQPL